MNKMLKFVDISARMPEKQKAEQRRQNFQELYAPFDVDKAAEQSSRCSQCGVPYCQVGCPLENNIPDWLKLSTEGRMKEAYLASSATNNFPEICGRICPQDRLCEGNCVLEMSDHEAVTIGAVERHITETAWENGWIKPIEVTDPRPESIGVVGAGPAGLAAAEELRKKGYQVHVYDRYDRIGGLLIYGIPNFKLDKFIVDRRAQLLRDSGIEFHLNTDVGQDITLEELQKKHHAVLLATGVYRARALNIMGAELDGVVPALPFLTAHNRLCLGDSLSKEQQIMSDVSGKHVVVVGGGDTAMDCVRTSIRQQAASVTCLYRRDRENMPGSLREVLNAEEEGVVFEWLKSPRAFVGEAGGAIASMKVQHMRLGNPDAQHRRRVEAIEGVTDDRPVDKVVLALGFEAEDMQAMMQKPDLSLTDWGTVRSSVDDGRTNIPGLYAAGDIVRGASLVVWAIRDARLAAQSIHQDLS